MKKKALLSRGAAQADSKDQIELQKADYFYTLNDLSDGIALVGVYKRKDGTFFALVKVELAEEDESAKADEVTDSPKKKKRPRSKKRKA